MRFPRTKPCPLPPRSAALAAPRPRTSTTPARLPPSPAPVTEPSLVLLAARQANKSGAELLEQGITILIRKLADPKDRRLASQKKKTTILPQSKFRLLL